MKKLLTLCLALCLLASVLPVAGVAEAAPYVNTSGETITLTCFLPMDGTLQDYIKDWNETPYFQNLEKLTGVHLEFISPTSSAAKETLNMLTLNDQMPDLIFQSNAYTGGPYQGYVDGYFADLAPYLEEYAPEYWSIITSSDDIWRETTDSNGVIAGMYRILTEEYALPVLSVDRPYVVGGSGQMRTRVQAFVESIEIKKIQGGTR